MNYIFEHRMKVRDYELDAQGVVNNANYQHYLEHTRHEFLESTGVSFMDITRQGIMAVVAKLELEFKQPLVSGDEFVCRLALCKEGIKYIFRQDIYRLSDNAIMLKGIVTIVCTEKGRPIRESYLDSLLRDFVSKND